MDMMMLSLMNARERERDDWTSLFRQADERLRLESIIPMEKGASAVIVATWDE